MHHLFTFTCERSAVRAADREHDIIRCKNLAVYIRDCVSLCLSDETIFNLQYFRPEKASSVRGVCTCIVGACGSVGVYLQHCDL